MDESYWIRRLKRCGCGGVYTIEKVRLGEIEHLEKVRFGIDGERIIMI